jgi:hypothetical protein
MRHSFHAIHHLNRLFELFLHRLVGLCRMKWSVRVAVALWDPPANLKKAQRPVLNQQQDTTKMAPQKGQDGTMIASQAENTCQLHLHLKHIIQEYQNCLEVGPNMTLKIAPQQTANQVHTCPLPYNSNNDSGQ